MGHDSGLGGPHGHRIWHGRYGRACDRRLHGRLCLRLSGGPSGRDEREASRPRARAATRTAQAVWPDESLVRPNGGASTYDVAASRSFPPCRLDCWSQPGCLLWPCSDWWSWRSKLIGCGRGWSALSARVGPAASQKSDNRLRSRPRAKAAPSQLAGSGCSSAVNANACHAPAEFGQAVAGRGPRLLSARRAGLSRRPRPVASATSRRCWAYFGAVIG